MQLTVAANGRDRKYGIADRPIAVSSFTFESSGESETFLTGSTHMTTPRPRGSVAEFCA